MYVPRPILPGIDFSKLLNCDRRAVVLDLMPSLANDAVIGPIEHFCRNGTILPKSMDVAQSIAVSKIPSDSSHMSSLIYL